MRHFRAGRCGSTEALPCLDEGGIGLFKLPPMIELEKIEAIRKG